MVDLVIVGGGPAGLATGIVAAQQGMVAAVFERRRLPLDKPCGEGVMPPGVRLLGDMGVRLPENGHVPFEGIRYLDGETVAEGRFPSSPGWGIRRTTLVGALVNRACELGVALHYGEAVRRWEVLSDREVLVHTDRGSHRGRFLVGADGLNSRVRRGLGVEKPGPRRKARFGMRRHYRIRPWSSFVEVHWQEGVEAYVTPVGAEEVGIALLFERTFGSFPEMLSRFPALHERLGSAGATSSLRGAGPFHHRAPRRHRGPVALVGDAAGYADALTGEGLSLAFASARALVSAIVQGDLMGYETTYRKLSRAYYTMTELLLRIAERPRLRRRLVRTLARDELLFDRLLALMVGEISWRGVGLRGWMGLLRGLGLP